MHVSSCQENGQHRRPYRRKGSQVANISAAPVEVRPDPEELETAILEALAEVRAAPVAELREEMAAAGGDLEIDSREASGTGFPQLSTALATHDVRSSCTIL